MERLAYRRQFVLARKAVAVLDEWKRINVGVYYLYAHPDLDAHSAGDADRGMVLLGCVFDPYEPDKGNCEIVEEILSGTTGLKSVFCRMKRYAGSYVILYFDGSEFAAWSDARSTQEVYYCASRNLIVCGSQPNLVAKLADPKIGPSKDPAVVEFYQRYLWDSRWVGDETYFEGVRHLLPNHYFDIEKMESRRYWPNEAIAQLSLPEAVSRGCLYLQGSMKAIVHRYRCMMGVTAGSDSRVLLAASRGFTDRIYCFLNTREMRLDHPEVQIPKKMLMAIGEEFHVHSVPEQVDDKFRSIYFDNVFLASDRLLPSIYNVFYRGHSDKVLILGVGEIGRTFYGLQPKGLTGHRMASKLGYGSCRYAVRQCEEYLSEMLPAADRFGINAMVILYWEQRLGNWGSARNSESNVAVQKVDPFNSHFLNEVFLGVDERYKDYQQDPCVLFREMVGRMWPELLAFPVNPAATARDRMKKVLMTVGAYEVLKEAKYQLSYISFQLKKSSSGAVS